MSSIHMQKSPIQNRVGQKRPAKQRKVPDRAKTTQLKKCLLIDTSVMRAVRQSRLERLPPSNASSGCRWQSGSKVGRVAERRPKWSCELWSNLHYRKSPRRSWHRLRLRRHAEDQRLRVRSHQTWRRRQAAGRWARQGHERAGGAIAGRREGQQRVRPRRRETAAGRVPRRHGQRHRCGRVAGWEAAAARAEADTRWERT